MYALNQTINWKPKSTGEGRFGNWIAGANDWNLSRSRFWGIPLPIWRTEDGKEELMVGSLGELKAEIKKAIDADWSTEYLSPKVSIAMVPDVGHAIAHINNYGSHHTDSIITENDTIAQLFQDQVDSGITMHNTSTQFADGGEFGMGAEIGIATGKMHARGPVGVEQLCSYKYYVKGTGQTRP